MLDINTWRSTSREQKSEQEREGTLGTYATHNTIFPHRFVLTCWLWVELRCFRFRPKNTKYIRHHLFVYVLLKSLGRMTCMSNAKQIKCVWNACEIDKLCQLPFAPFHLKIFHIFEHCSHQTNGLSLEISLLSRKQRN